MAFGTSIDQRKKNKRNHVVDLFRRNRLLSKIQTRKLSGYSMNTVLTIFDSLIDEEIIVEADGEQKPLGRKATFYRLNEGKMLYLGITFNQSGIYSSLVSFSGGILETGVTMLRNDIQRDDFLLLLADAIREILQRKPEYHPGCVAVGISVPGDIDVNSGILRSYTLMPRLNGIDFLGLLKQLLPGMRHAVDHNIRSMTSYFLMDRELVENNAKILFISARSGTANGIISSGSIVTAHGEFGHVRVSDNPDRCICGRTGCLDNYFSYNAFMKLIAEKVDPSVLDDEKPGDIPGLGVLVRLYREGNREIKEELDSRLSLFSMALLDVINVTVPDMVILSGDLFRVYGDPVDSIKEVMGRNFPDSGYVPHFKNARLDYRDLGTEIASLGICHSMIQEDWDYIQEEER